MEYSSNQSPDQSVSRAQSYQDYEEPRQRRSSNGANPNLLTYGLLGIGAFLIVNSLNGGAPGRVELNQDDYDFLSETGPNALQTLVDNDTSPVLYTSQGNTPRTPEQTAALLAALKKRYVDDAAVGTLSFPSNMFSDAMMALLDIDDQTIRTQTMDMFVKMFSLFNEIFSVTVVACAMGVAQTVKAAGEAINDANECTEWTWAKKTDYTTEQTSTTNTTISTRATSTKVLLGILGSGGSTSTMHNTIKTESLKERQVVEFIPHCTSFQVNLTAVEAILIAQGAALKSIYDPLRAVIALAPVIPPRRQFRIPGSPPKVALTISNDGSVNVIERNLTAATAAK